MPSTIGSRIRTLRKQAEMSISDLAAKTKIDGAQLSKMENNKFGLPGVHRIRLIARALGATPNDIILGHALAAAEEAARGKK